MPFRFIHAADIHLDSPLRSLALRDTALAELIGTATRRAFTNIVALCLEEQVDALLLSGDLYDGDQTSMKTARFLADQVGLLHAAGVAVFVIRGNHDALSRITRELAYPDSVVIFGSRAGVVEVPRERGALPIAVHGISFAHHHAPESLLGKYRQPVEGAFNIGLLHTSLGGSPGHDPYSPCSIEDLGGSGFRYWALGHVHRRSTAGDAATIVMPGMPQGRDIGESGPKSVTLVTVSDDGSVELEERLTSVAQFERVTVDLAAAEDWRGVAATIADALGLARDATRSETLVARLLLTGTTPLAWQLRRDMDVLRAEAERQASAVGRTWIDTVELDIRPPAATPGSDGWAAADPLEELRGLMGDVAADAAYRQEVAEIAESLRSQLPQECRAMLGTDPGSFAATLDAVARDGIEEVLARLRGASSEGAG